MYPSVALLAVFLADFVLLVSSYNVQYWDYIVVGAGPAGLQSAYHLQQAGRNYVVLEQANCTGAFFNIYPRHDKLISINKRHTGQVNREFNLRHDWNSLVSHDESLLYKHYSHEFFPARETMLQYLSDYHRRLNLNVAFNTQVSQVTRAVNTTTGEVQFEMRDQNNNKYIAKTLIMAIGISRPNIPNFVGIEHVEGYEDVSIDPEEFEGQSVLILGRGNSAFEVGGSIYGHTNMIHIMGRSRVRLSWETHYVGDIRAINNALLDTYQLKSLDGVLEAPFEQLMVIKQADGKFRIGVQVNEMSEEGGTNDMDGETDEDMESRMEGGKGGRMEGRTQEHMEKNMESEMGADIEGDMGADMEGDMEGDMGAYMKGLMEGDMEVNTEPVLDEPVNKSHPDISMFDNFALREPYDRIIRCLGFSFNDSLFLSPSQITYYKKKSLKKYPRIHHTYESMDMPGLFFVGPPTHSLDHRKSAGGFIHGFRYTAGALHHILEWRNHQVSWPSITLSLNGLLPYITKRMNEASAIYQMFSVLGDVIAIRDGEMFEYYESYPVKLVPEFEETAGVKVDAVVVLVLEYGQNFSGPGKDTFREDRATGEPSEGHLSNFLHPVLYYYEKLPTDEEMKALPHWQVMPRPQRLHHIVEDFLAIWNTPVSHVLPLRRFFENITDLDLRNFYSDDCMMLLLLSEDVPLYCRTSYLQGQGIAPDTGTVYAAAKTELRL